MSKINTKDTAKKSVESSSESKKDAEDLEVKTPANEEKEKKVSQDTQEEKTQDVLLFSLGKETDKGSGSDNEQPTDDGTESAENKERECNCNVSEFLTSIQRTIDRMSGNSAIFKTIFATFIVMSVTIFIGFESSDDCKVCPIATPIYAGFICFIVASFLVFSLFDAYYLSLERGYVNLYNKIRKTKDVSDFKYVPITVRTIDTEDKNGFFQQKDYDRTRIWKCWISPTVIWFYLPFLLGAVAIVTICFLYSIKSGKAATCTLETQGLKNYINLLMTTLFSSL